MLNQATTSPRSILSSRDLMADITAPEVHSSTLDNGMMVVTMPDSRATATQHMVWYRNGSAEDPTGKSGIAHFLEHLMFKGTERHRRGALDGFVTQVGGQLNAFTGNCYTCYFETVPSEHLAACMDFEADRMKNIRIDDETVSTEREVILAERGMRVDANPEELLREAVSKCSFAGTAYEHPVIGWREEIEGLKRQDALDYYERFYSPENAILVVAGDVEHAIVLDLAQKIYGPIPRSPIAGTEKIRARPTTRAKAEIILERSPAVQQEQLSFTYTFDKSAVSIEALEILSHYLSSNHHSLLQSELVTKRKLAVYANASAMSQLYEGVVQFFVHAVPTPGTELATLQAALEECLLDLAQTGINGDDLERTKSNLLVSQVFAADMPGSFANTFGALLSLGETIESIAAWPNRLCEVTRDDITRTLALLNPDHAVIGHLAYLAGSPHASMPET